MAHKINTLLKEKSENDNFLILCPIEQMAYGFGIPERIWKKDSSLSQKSYLIYSHVSD
jgi:hypothetical protein